MSNRTQNSGGRARRPRTRQKAQEIGRTSALGQRKGHEKYSAEVHQEAVEVIEEHAVEDRALGMTGTIDSGHGGRKASRYGPSP